MRLVFAEHVSVSLCVGLCILSAKKEHRVRVSVNGVDVTPFPSHTAARPLSDAAIFRPPLVSGDVDRSPSGSPNTL